jgi:hypothetical protein
VRDEVFLQGNEVGETVRWQALIRFWSCVCAMHRYEGAFGESMSLKEEK